MVPISVGSQHRTQVQVKCLVSSVGKITKEPPTDIKEPSRHLPKFWHFSSSDDIANVEWEVCDCHLGNLDLLHDGERAIQGISFRSVMGWMSYIFVVFCPGYILIKLLHTSSPFFISFCARTTTLPVGDTKNLKRSFLGFSPEEVVHLLLARQLWERNEKLGKSHRPFLAPMKAALVRKIPIKGGTTCGRPLCTPMVMMTMSMIMRANDYKY